MLNDYIDTKSIYRGVYEFLEGGCGCGEQKKIIIILINSL